MFLTSKLRIVKRTKKLRMLMEEMLKRLKFVTRLAPFMLVFMLKPWFF